MALRRIREMAAFRTQRIRHAEARVVDSRESPRDEAETRVRRHRSDSGCETVIAEVIPEDDYVGLIAGPFSFGTTASDQGNVPGADEVAGGGGPRDADAVIRGVLGRIFDDDRY